MDQTVEVVAFPLPGPDRLLQRVQDELGAHTGAGPPAENPPRIGIDDERDVDPPRPRRHIRDVGHPQPVRCQRREPAADQVIGPLGNRIGDGRALHRSPPNALQPRTTHEPFHGAASHRDAFAVELQPDLAGPVNTIVGLVDPADLDQQRLNALLTLGGELVAPLVVGRWGDLHVMLAEHLADRLDAPPQPIRLTPVGMFTDEVDDH